MLSFLYKFLAVNRMLLYSAQETCIPVHVTKIARSDWSAVFVAGNVYYIKYILYLIYHIVSAATMNYATPRLRTKFGEMVFSHTGPAAWNRLPETIHQAQM